jgi:CheY-like chemotaxis protein
MLWARPSRGAMTPEREVARILIEGADAPLQGLLEAWLADDGLLAVEERPDLIVVDLPLARADGKRLVDNLAARYPGVPLVVLSSNFFAGVEPNGAVARSLGVDAVLPKPLSHEALLRTLSRLLPQRE